MNLLAVSHWKQHRQAIKAFESSARFSYNFTNEAIVEAFIVANFEPTLALKRPRL